MTQQLAKDTSVSISKNRQLRDVSFTFRNLFKGGHLSAAEILREAGNAHTEHRAVMQAGAKKILEKGWSFPDAVKGIFPPDVMPAIVAGSESGNLFQVFDQIWRASKSQEEINGVLKKLVMPVTVMLAALALSLISWLFLVPYTYESLARSAPPGYDPGFIVNSALATNAWLEANPVLALVGTAVIVLACAFALLNPNNRSQASTWLIQQMLKVKSIGSAYANLRFGLMARYLEIVSMAGLDIQRSLQLVSGTLPEALLPAFALFQRDVVADGMKEAARSEGRPESDPRSSPVYWPTYVRLGFSQAYDTGNIDEAMNEYGSTMIADGKERLELYITQLNRFVMMVGGLIAILPMATTYTVLGEIMTMRLQSM